VVTEVRQLSRDEYVLNSEGKLFSAIYIPPEGALPAFRVVPIGSKVRVTGICVQEVSSPYHEVPFHILLRSFDDIALVARPSLLNIRNLLILVGLLLVAVTLAGARGWATERKMRRQSAAISASNEAEAELERQRSHILEDINGSRPLTEILLEITAMVSAMLDGAPDSRSDPSLGVLFAAFDPAAPPAPREGAAMLTGARLATLAIGARRLYSDLLHRSEFDLLTDIPNRFAMEQFMDTKIEEARHSGLTLGLIYIDLDRFKPINDNFGHRAGDLYLQEVALRLTNQLLGSDMLARLGGDEFAAMVSLPLGRSDLERIVARLERCFREPFTIAGHVLHGSASFGIALYPEDGETRDSLLSAADAAMYAVKNRKKELESVRNQLHEPKLGH
jgi:diguanylate cyclase (GGDEF)-like protein